jgi:hypothetical protein
MTSLHIFHTVHDFDDWLAAFNSFTDLRAAGGVTGVTVRHAVDDPNFITVDLEFDTSEEAVAYLARLETEIWPNSPHIDSTPTPRVMETVGAVV